MSETDKPTWPDCMRRDRKGKITVLEFHTNDGGYGGRPGGPGGEGSYHEIYRDENGHWRYCATKELIVGAVIGAGGAGANVSPMPMERGPDIRS